MNIVKELKFTRLSNGVVAGTGDTIDSAVLDNQGFETACFMLLLGAITATAVLTFKIQQGDLADGSDMDDLAGSKQLPVDGDDNKMVISEIVRPTKRYLRVRFIRATANAVLDAIIAIQGDAHVLPVTQGATVFGTPEIFSSPDEGTA